MNNKQLKIFFAAFFSETENLDKLIQTPEDNLLKIHLTYLQWPNEFLEITVLEILRMNLDCWYEMTNTIDENIEPKKIYKNTKDSIRLIQNKFNLKQSKPKINYENYYNFIYVFSEDEEYFDDNEISEFITDGYRKIDLELINYAYKRNKGKVLELLRKGANPYIDPLDKIFESSILDSLLSEYSLKFINLVGTYDQYLKDGYHDLQETVCYDFLEELYGTASSIELYRTIENYSKFKKDVSQ